MTGLASQRAKVCSRPRPIRARPLRKGTFWSGVARTALPLTSARNSVAPAFASSSIRVATRVSSPMNAMSTGSGTPSAANMRRYEGRANPSTRLAPTEERVPSMSSVTHTGSPTITRGAGRPALAAAARITGTMSSPTAFVPVSQVTVPSLKFPRELQHLRSEGPDDQPR